MNRLSAKSRTRLSQCHPDLQVLFLVVLQQRDYSVTCGARSKAEQDDAVRAGRSKARWPKSNHNVDGRRRRTSWAVDVVPYPFPGWQRLEPFAEFADFVMGVADELYERGHMRHRIRWGGDWDQDGQWKDERFFDGPHFELLDVADGE